MSINRKYWAEKMCHSWSTKHPNFGPLVFFCNTVSFADLDRGIIISKASLTTFKASMIFWGSTKIDLGLKFNPHLINTLYYVLFDQKYPLVDQLWT
jgi:hypothetical protein